MPGRDRSIGRSWGGDGRRAKGEGPAECPNTHHGWRDRHDRGRDMGARGRTLRARATAAMRVIYVEDGNGRSVGHGGRSDTVVGRTPVVDPCVSNA